MGKKKDEPRRLQRGEVERRGEKYEGRRDSTASTKRHGSSGFSQELTGDRTTEAEENTGLNKNFIGKENGALIHFDILISSQSLYRSFVD